MIKDAQVHKLRQFLGEGHPLYRAALKVGMDAKSARKYRHADRLPSESLAPKEGKRKAKGTLVNVIELSTQVKYMVRVTSI